MMWAVAAFLVAMSSETTGLRNNLTLTASKPFVVFHPPKYPRAHNGIAYYSWHVSAPGNVNQLTLSCVVDIIDSPRCSKASFVFFDYKKIRLCGRKIISRTLRGSTNLFIFKSSMCFNFNHRGVSCTVSYNPDDIPTCTTPVDHNCKCGDKEGRRIVGGNNAKPNDYPWQAKLKKKTFKSPFCGGSVISRQWILTACHCVVNRSASSIMVLLGEHNYKGISSLNNSAFEVIEVIMHEKYAKKDVFEFDIALLKLAKPATFNKVISSVCLPFNYKYYDFTDKIGTITGWGKTVLDDRRIYPKVLKEVDQKIIMPSKCTWLDGYVSYQSVLNENTLCALTVKGSCSSGDSGAPMVWRSESSDLYFQLGIFSSGSNSLHWTKPNQYTRVSQFVDWIMIKTGAGNELCVKI